MNSNRKRFRLGAALLAAVSTAATLAAAEDNPITNAIAVADSNGQLWNIHGQNTEVLDGHPGFHAKYTGPGSLSATGEVQETVEADIFTALRLWRGSELHVDGLLWQGFGFSRTYGVEAFPNSAAFKTGTKIPNVVFARVFLRQTFGLGGEQENIPDDAFYLAGKEDVARVTMTIGKFSPKDIFDNNSYANDPLSQFLSWGLMANEAWDYPADSLGFTTGASLELIEPKWTLRYGFFQMPRVSNGLAQDKNYLDAWGMAGEFERRFAWNDHPGALRFLAYLNRANMGSYEAVVDDPSLGGNIIPTREYRYKFGFGLNAEQELTKGIGIFSRLGWSNGRTEAWVFSDVDYAGSLGLSVNGAFWHRTNDTYAVAGVLSGATHIHQQYFNDGGVGILAGDGRLDYGIEKVMETYYDFAIWKTLHGTLDYQFIADPAFNQDRGPVHVFSMRLHVEF